ncbi:MAG: alpha/beta fold hydrolase [Planctomycetota bacterium]
MTAVPQATSRNAVADTPFAAEYPFAHHYADVGGHRMHYVDEGSGPVLLCVHGNPTWSFAWRHVVTAFRDRFRVVAVDHIGCGLSDKPQEAAYTLDWHIENLGRLVERLGLTDITLVAHDWGGAIGTGLATRRPELFTRFVLMNTAAFRVSGIPFRIRVCRWPGLGPLGVRGFNLFAGMATTMTVERSLLPAAKAGYLFPYNSWANRVAVQRFVEDIPQRPGDASYDTLVAIEEGLAELQDRPMLLPWGMKDWCFSPKFLDEFRRRFPNAEVHEFADAGHYVFEDAKDELIDAMDAFFAE